MTGNIFEIIVHPFRIDHEGNCTVETMCSDRDPKRAGYACYVREESPTELVDAHEDESFATIEEADAFAVSLRAKYPDAEILFEEG